MTKGTKIFRIIISILLALTMLISAFFTFFFCLYFETEEYGIYVAGVAINRGNQDDVLGDGKVFYDPENNVLVFGDATIEYDDIVVYSKIDLNIQLFGENKIICTNEENSIGIYAGSYNVGKDLSIGGDGTLTIETPNSKVQAVGISAEDLILMTDVTVTTPDCEGIVNGIVCSSSLMIVDESTVTVNNGSSATYGVAVRVRGNALLEKGTTLKISSNPGSTDICGGLDVSGDLFLGENTTLDVSIDDGTTELGRCIRISGLMEVGIGSTVTASAKNTPAIECFGTIEANEGAVISASSEKNDYDIFCSGAIINFGAEINGDVDAISGIHHRD